MSLRSTTSRKCAHQFALELERATHTRHGGLKRCAEYVRREILWRLLDEFTIDEVRGHGVAYPRIDRLNAFNIVAMFAEIYVPVQLCITRGTVYAYSYSR